MPTVSKPAMRRLGALKPRVARLDSRRVKPMPKAAAAFYATREWRGLVAAVIGQRGRRCEQCGKTHDDSGRPVRIFGDHVIELKDGGAPLDARNIALLCGSCHTRKSAAERAQRR